MKEPVDPTQISAALEYRALRLEVRQHGHGSIVNNIVSVLDRAQRDETGGFYLNDVLSEQKTELRPVPRLYTGLMGFGAELTEDIQTALKT